MNPGCFWPDDATDYEPFDVTQMVRSPNGGAWVYFPAGGTLEVGCGDARDPRCTHGAIGQYVYGLSPNTGQWQLEGNGSPCGSEQLKSGPIAVYTYTPQQGYAPAPVDAVIPVGHAVWYWLDEGNPLELLEPADPPMLYDPVNPRCG